MSLIRPPWGGLPDLSLSLSLSLYSFLVNHGLLLVRDVGKACSWWFAIPGVSPFTKSYTKGKRTLPLDPMKCAVSF